MVLIREDYHLGRDAAQLGGIEGGHTLRGKDAEVIFAVAHHNRGCPFIHKAVWRLSKCALSFGIVLIPESAAHIPIGKPHLLRLKVLCLGVKYAGVSKQCGKTAIMVARKPIH